MGKIRVALVGAGALGSELALQLAGDHVLAPLLRHILIVDPDGIELDNVPLSRVFSQAYAAEGAKLLGRSKARVLAAWLRERSSLRWSALAAEIADVGWQRLGRCDLIVSCTDSVLARLETTLIARTLRIPMLDGGVYGSGSEGGRVTWFEPAPEAACALCGLGEERRAEMLAFTGAVALGCRLPSGASMRGSPQAPASVRVTAAALRMTLRQQLAGGWRVEDGPAQSWAKKLRTGTAGGVLWDRILLGCSPSCPWHEGMDGLLVAIAPERPLREALLAAGAAARHLRLQFPWPIAVHTICGGCGHSQVRPRRVALQRRQGCERCGAARLLQPVRTVSSLSIHDSVAHMTPRQLGLPERHLLQLRPSLVSATAVHAEEQ